MKQEEQATKHQIIHHINQLSEPDQSQFLPLQHLIQQLQQCYIEHPLEKWDVDSPTTHIPTVHNIPVQGKPFRQKLEDEAKLHTQIQDLLDKGLIRPSQSNYACQHSLCENIEKKSEEKPKWSLIMSS